MCLKDFEAFKVGAATIFHGSNLDVLPFMADNSVDSIVCDPPYELGFMGKKWDSSGIAYSGDCGIVTGKHCCEIGRAHV